MISPKPDTVAERTARRHRHYSNEQREVLNLAANLRQLAEQYPRFRQSLNKLKHRVELQLAKPAEKRRRILFMLGRARILTIEELVMDTSLDEISVRETLEQMVLVGKVETCDRDGSPLIVGKGAGKGWRARAYYRLARPAAKTAPAVAGLSLVAGPSQRSSRKG